MVGPPGMRCVRCQPTAPAPSGLPCSARAVGPSQNSLRSLRSLRSNSCDESDHEARVLRHARPTALRASAAHRAGSAHSACRAQGLFFSPGTQRSRPASAGGKPAGERQPAASTAAKDGSGPQLFERSEFCGPRLWRGAAAKSEGPQAPAARRLAIRRRAPPALRRLATRRRAANKKTTFSPEAPAPS